MFFGSFSELGLGCPPPFIEIFQVSWVVRLTICVHIDTVGRSDESQLVIPIRKLLFVKPEIICILTSSANNRGVLGCIKPIVVKVLRDLKSFRDQVEFVDDLPLKLVDPNECSTRQLISHEL